MTLKDWYVYLSKMPDRNFLRRAEVDSLLPILVKEDEWLKHKFGEGFFDDEITFSDEPVLLTEDACNFFIEISSLVAPRIRAIIDRHIEKFS